MLLLKENYIMKIKRTHPLAHHSLIVGEQINHNRISYYVDNEANGVYELVPEPLCVWKGRTCY